MCAYVCLTEMRKYFHYFFFFALIKNQCVLIGVQCEEQVGDEKMRQANFPSLDSLLHFREKMLNSAPINVSVSRLPLFSFSTSVYTKTFIIKVKQTVGQWWNESG